MSVHVRWAYPLAVLAIASALLQACAGGTVHPAPPPAAMPGLPGVRLYDDPRVVAWSADYLAGRREAVIAAVEQDLLSPAPHPFAPHVWVTTQAALGRLEQATAGIQDPKLRSALGVLPTVVQHYNARQYTKVLAT